MTPYNNLKRTTPVVIKTYHSNYEGAGIILAGRPSLIK